MTDWLGMAPPPRSPHPELKARVLGRALRPRRSVWPLAAAALVLLVGGSGGEWGTPTNRAVGGGGGTLPAPPAGPHGNLDSFLLRGGEAAGGGAGATPGA